MTLATISKNKKKPQLTKEQIGEVQWLNKPRGKDAILVGKFKEFWVLSKKGQESPILVYDQAEWDAFINGTKNHEFDNLVNV